METTRICKKCDRNLPLKSFGKWTDKKSGITFIKYICNTCKSNRYRELNPEKSKARSRKYWKKRSEINPQLRMNLMKSIGQTQCKICGFSDPKGLCFHHRDPKEKKFSIKFALTHSYSFETMLTEAKKCDILCANCHLKLHYVGETGENKYKAKKMRYLKLQLMNDIHQNCCKICGEEDPTILSFHHTRDKKFIISKGIVNCVPYDILFEEAKKCDILCGNCHFILHNRYDY